VGWGCTRSWERTQPGQLTTADHRDIPHRVMSCSAIKAGEEGGRGDIRSEGICFPKSPLNVMEPCCPGDG